ncbi:MAG: 3-oxoacyl-ACP reductase family protein [Elusimicrobiota bacterium]
MKLDMAEKVVLVTGASRGIGAAIARAVARQGAVVVVNYVRNKDKAEEVLDQIKSDGGRGIAVQADVRDREAVDRMVEAAVGEFGGIDVLVNNANIAFPIKPFVEFSWEELEAKLTGEMKALFYPAQAVLRDMTRRKSGKLIFVSSGLSRHPGFGFSAHAAAKAAMDGIAKVMAMELGPRGITVNVVGPGLVRTDATSGIPAEQRERVAGMTPLGRVGEPEDIAGTVVFLASPLSDYVTGEYIPVNGGSFML